ncbi:MAG: helix-turn-helix transcriptional regulator [Acidobacteria bacterium]|nr:helix-turn-helix transcriptional regulator [Acidobacteriota bacterium]
MLTKRQLARLRAAAVTPGSNRLGLALSLMGVSQGRVAGAVGVPQPYVSDVVRGRYRTITVANARRFARYCGCLIEDLFPADTE